MTRFILAVLCILTNAAYGSDRTETGFFYPIGTDDFDQQCGTWLSRDAQHGGCYFSNEYHVGVDMMRDEGKDAYAVADGKVAYISYDKPGDGDGKKWGVNNCGLVIEHKTHDGNIFTAVYGHVQCATVPSRNTEVYGGRPIGKIGHWDHGDHLHFGIHEGPFSTMAKSGWGKMPNINWPSQNTFTDPVRFIQTHSPHNPPTEVQVRCQGNICWAPTTSSCEGANARYRLGNNMFAQPAGMEACVEAQEKLFSIADSPNPQEEVLEDGLWQKFFRAIRNVFGETVSAADIRAFGTINTINVYTGNVVAGNATKAVYGTGQGYSIQAIAPPAPEPPDFVTTKTWLTTPWGTEVYKYGLNESFDTKAQTKNIGDGPCNPDDTTQTITGHFYLSRGYKKDPSSGDGARRRIDSTTTQCDNLKPGDTNTETKNTRIRDWITEPGIYNIIYCPDHPLDDHNGVGDHREKHESNNCGTEMVFEVVEGTVNVPDVDFTPSGFTSLQAPVYAGDFIRLGAWITNQGTVNATADIRSAYTVSCNGGPHTVLADDGTMASTLTAGASAWEETLTPVQLPNVVGTCTLSFFVDSLGSQPETDETNNTESLTVTLAPRPAPKLVITKFQDESGCCTTNLGKRIKPDIWVRNDGPVAPGSNVTVVYHISSPVATGGAYLSIGSGTIRADELPPGGTDEDYMDNQWTIPKSSAWKKQWHTVRGCLRQDGSTPVGDPNTEVCAYYYRYSKE